MRRAVDLARGNLWHSEWNRTNSERLRLTDSVAESFAWCHRYQLEQRSPKSISAQKASTANAFRLDSSSHKQWKGTGYGVTRRRRGFERRHSCTDHDISWRVRHNLGFDHLSGVGGVSGDANHSDNIIYDIVANPDGTGGASPAAQP